MVPQLTSSPRKAIAQLPNLVNDLENLAIGVPNANVGVPRAIAPLPNLLNDLENVAIGVPNVNVGFQRRSPKEKCYPGCQLTIVHSSVNLEV
ncbi:MAG TPA: hypothetical protein DCQ32_00685 [Cyanobacteria bacterium UBA8156]|jgi:hypothetical protein|nr:hypothetical protein [Cyanobacteria bacterium UBA8156]